MFILHFGRLGIVVFKFDFYFMLDFSLRFWVQHSNDDELDSVLISSTEIELSEDSTCTIYDDDDDETEDDDAE